MNGLVVARQVSLFSALVGLLLVGSSETALAHEHGAHDKVSALGSDAQSKGWKKYLIRLFQKKYWSYTIVKSESMAIQLNLKDYNVIPNGVDLNKIKPIDKIDSKNLDTVIFVADPSK